MGLLSKLAKASARASGRALAAHVLPDSLVPSWKTQKKLSSGYSLLKKAGKGTAKKKQASASSKRAAAPARRPGPKAPAKKFDKQSWSMGRALPSGDGFAVKRPSSEKSSFLSSAKAQASKLRRQSIDLARNPRVAAQMGLDLLAEDYRVKKQSFLSSLKKK